MNGAGWNVSLHSLSGLGVARYMLHDSADNSQVLGVEPAGSQTVAMTNLQAVETFWYFVPAPPFGWAIYHGTTGLRLEVDAANRLVLSERLDGDAYWDFLRNVPGGPAQPHHWPPGPLQQPFAAVPRRRVTNVPNMEAVVGTNGTGISFSTRMPFPGGTRLHQSNYTATTFNEAECVAACAKDPNCTACTWCNEGECYSFMNATLDAKKDFRVGWAPYNGVPIETPYVIPFTTADLERKLFGDSNDRRAEYRDDPFRIPGSSAGSVWGSNTNYTMYRKITAPAPEVAYRECLIARGMDDPRCQAIRDAAPDPFAVGRSTLAQYAGQTQAGLCGGLASDDVGAVPVPGTARLWSQTCREFCRDERARKDGLCSKGLRTHCAPQTAGGHNDPMCDCYLADDTYRSMRDAWMATLSADARAIVQATATTMENLPKFCAFAPCRTADNRPRTEVDCPVGDINNCIQIDRDNVYSGAGHIDTEKA